jgi:hypothetical protein
MAGAIFYEISIFLRITLGLGILLSALVPLILHVLFINRRAGWFVSLLFLFYPVSGFIFGYLIHRNFIIPRLSLDIGISILVLALGSLLRSMSIQRSQTKLATGVKKAEKLALEGEYSFSDEKYDDANAKFDSAKAAYKFAAAIYTRQNAGDEPGLLQFLKKMNNRINASEQAKRDLQKQKEEIITIIEKTIK